MSLVKTKEIAEAAVFYLNNLGLQCYKDKHWHFTDDEGKADELKMKLINKKLTIEPLEFMDAVRRVKSFSNTAGTI